MGSGWISVGVAAAISALLLFVAQPSSPVSMLLAIFATLPLFLVGLSLGWFHGAAAAGAASIAILFAIGPAPAGYYAIVNAIPVTMLLVAVERHPNTPVRAVLTLVGLAAVPMVVGALLFSSSDGGLSGVIRERLGDFQAMMSVSPRDMSPEEWQALLNALAAILPGLGAVFWVLLITLNGALAQGLLTRVGKARLPTPDIAAVRLPRWMPGVLAAITASSFLPGEMGYLGTNLVPLAALPFLFSGLGVVHALLRGVSGAGLWFALVYVLLLVLVWPAVIVLGLGLIDSIVDFRRRFGRSGPPPDDE
ncbi:MAG: DUF2232 domain-containing protein [Alphaproteobacteria bacterium]|nr:DUF2232 domain-containing protein [Alphaproteobacteria bacterium]